MRWLSPTRWQSGHERVGDARTHIGRGYWRQNIYPLIPQRGTPDTLLEARRSSGKFRRYESADKAFAPIADTPRRKRRSNLRPPSAKAAFTIYSRSENAAQGCNLGVGRAAIKDAKIRRLCPVAAITPSEAPLAAADRGYERWRASRQDWREAPSRPSQPTGLAS